MLRKKEEMRSRTEVNLKGGNGTINMLDLLSPDDYFNEGRLVSRAVMPVGGSIGYHEHQNEFEIYYILNGTAKTNDNGVEKIMNAGDCSVCGHGCSHSLENAGDTPLEYLAIIFFINK